MDVIAQTLLDMQAYEEQERLLRYQRAWDAYYGRYKKPLKVKAGQPDDNVIVNFTRVIVDKGVSFLFGKEVDFELDKEETSPAEEYLDSVWQANRKATFLHKVALNGGVCGNAFVKIVDVKPLPRLINLDPETVSVRWDPDDIDRVTRYKIQYTALNDTGKHIVKRQLVEEDGGAWVLTDQESQPDSSTWITLSETRWPHPYPPIVDCQNLPAPNVYWGLSDLESDIIGLAAAINFILSNTARIIRIHAHPKLWIVGATENEVAAAIDELMVFGSTEARMGSVEMQSDLSSSIEFYKRLKEALHEVARIPEVATGKVDSAGALSGVALQILYAPLIELTETKRRTYGDMLIEINRRLLDMAGYGSDLITELHWQGLVPSDPLADRQAYMLDQQMGIASKQTIASKLDYDYEIEQQNIENEGADAGEQMLEAFDKGE